MANLLYQNIGHFLTLSNSLDLCVNSCFENFIEEFNMLDKLQQENFDHKCKRLSHYCTLFYKAGEINEKNRDKFKIKLEEFGRRYSNDILKTRNYLAHSVVLEVEENNHKIISSKRFKEDDAAINSLAEDELKEVLEKLKHLSREFHEFSRDVQDVFLKTKLFIDYGKRELN